jgi:TetR/AcrR family transcriptional regulator, cholesterol catabolism regulator
MKVSIVLRAQMKKDEEKILKGAYELFYRHGVKRITMDDIASHLGISKKTIYENYDNKDELVLALMKSELEKQKKDMEAIRKRSGDPIDEIINIMSYLANKFSQINPGMFYDLQKYHSDSWKYFRDFKEGSIQAFVEANLKKGVKSGLYRKDINIPILSRLRVEQIELSFNSNVFPPHQFRIADVCVELLNHFVHGIASLKGYQLIERYKKQLSRSK